MIFRLVRNSGDVSEPSELSPLENAFTRPRPLDPTTCICPGIVPRNGPGPNAPPVTVHGA